MQRRRGTLGDDSDMTVKRTSPEARSIRSCESAIPVPGTVFHAIFLLFSLSLFLVLLFSPPPSRLFLLAPLFLLVWFSRQVLSLLLLFSLVPSLTPSSPNSLFLLDLISSLVPLVLSITLARHCFAYSLSFPRRGMKVCAYIRTCGCAYVRRSTGLYDIFFSG